MSSVDEGNDKIITDRGFDTFYPNLSCEFVCVQTFFFFSVQMKNNDKAKKK